MAGLPQMSYSRHCRRCDYEDDDPVDQIHADTAFKVFNRGPDMKSRSSHTERKSDQAHDESAEPGNETLPDDHI